MPSITKHGVGDNKKMRIKGMKKTFLLLMSGLMAVSCAGCSSDDEIYVNVDNDKSSKKKTSSDKDNDDETKKSADLFGDESDEDGDDAGDDQKEGKKNKETKEHAMDEQRLLDDIDYLLTGDKKEREGQYITFGRYEQDNDTSNGAEPIEWEVITEDGGKVLLVSRYALEFMPFNTVQDSVYWGNCSLHAWMNNEFYESAFTDAEKKLISPTARKLEAYWLIDSESIKDVVDYVFCLNYKELEKYYTIEKGYYCYTCEDIKTEPSEYVREKAMEYGSKQAAEHGYGDAMAFGGMSEEGFINWWLSDASPTYGAAGKVTCSGNFGWDMDGYTFLDESNNKLLGVRPAIWISKGE